VSDKTPEPAKPVTDFDRDVEMRIALLKVEAKIMAHFGPNLGPRLDKRN
jgi:hypothetical protein